MAKMGILFNGFNELAEAIDRAGLDLHKAVDEALTETHKIVQTNVTNASAVYARKGKQGYATGRMYKTLLKDTIIEWRGSVATVRVGYDFRFGAAFHSIFVMHGTPTIDKDTKLYNSIWGRRTKNQIEDKQKEIMQKYLEFRK